MAVAACTLDFNRYEPKAGVSADASDDGISSEATGPESDSATNDEPEASADGSQVDASAMDSTAPEGAADGAPLDAPADGVADGTADVAGESGAVDAADSGAVDAPGTDSAGDAGSLTSGLVAFYQFDETGGTSAADSSGNGHTATLVGGATFTGGLQNNAVTMSGVGQYVSLPTGIVSGLSAFSISAWVNLNSAPTWSRIFDFGTSTTVYMFLTPNSGTGLRFSVTTGGLTQEQQLNASAPGTRTWQHVVVTVAANSGVLYVNGAMVAQNTSMTLTPAALGSTTQNWLGRSQFNTDPYLNGQIDNFRIYDRALSAAEVQTLHSGHL
jgi:hypothetical protein